MAIPYERLKEIIDTKDLDAALASCEKHRYSEGWRITDDGAIIIYDCDNPPNWLPPVDPEDESTGHKRFATGFLPERSRMDQYDRLIAECRSKIDNPQLRERVISTIKTHRLVESMYRAITPMTPSCL